MRHYKVYEINEDFEAVEVIYSEKEIINEYWDIWYELMCDQFSAAEVNDLFTQKDCTHDWVILNNAIEVQVH